MEAFLSSEYRSVSLIVKEKIAIYGYDSPLVDRVNRWMLHSLQFWRFRVVGRVGAGGREAVRNAIL
jgi:hypothetical protein